MTVPPAQAELSPLFLKATIVNHAEVDKHETAITNREAAVAKREAEVEKREAVITNREAVITNREAEVEKRALKIAELEWILSRVSENYVFFKKS
jgi:uncharacterized protein (DUF3084 family)